METQNVKRLQKLLEAVVTTSTATDDQIILRTTAPGAPALTLGDIKQTLDELKNMFISCEEVPHMFEQLTEKYYV